MKLIKKIFIFISALVLLIGIGFKNYTKEQYTVDISKYIDRALKFQEKKPELIARARLISIEKYRLEMEAVKKETKFKKEEPKITQNSNNNIVTSVKPKTEKPDDKKDADVPIKYQYEYLHSIENEIVRLCNIERNKKGLTPLAIDKTLTKTAGYKANEMLQYEYFSHISPVTGLNPWELAASFGYSFRAFGENIWMGKGYQKEQLTAELIVEGWMNSKGHRENILSDKFGKIGVGVIFSKDIKRIEAVQEFSN